MNDELDYGPRGYLPERASKRARKIVLRAPLGLQWVWASVAAGVVLLIAVLLFLRMVGTPPDEPWRAIGQVTDLPASQHLDDPPLLVVAAGGRIRAFADASDVAWCPASNRLESPDGRVWSLTGRGRGTESLTEHPTLVWRDTLYVDPTVTSSAPAPSADVIEPGCH